MTRTRRFLTAFALAFTLGVTGAAVSETAPMAAENVEASGTSHGTYRVRSYSWGGCYVRMGDAYGGRVVPVYGWTCWLVEHGATRYATVHYSSWIGWHTH